MKNLSKLACALTLCMSTSAIATEAPAPQVEKQFIEPAHITVAPQTSSHAVDPVTVSTIGSWILKGAKSAVVNRVKSFLKDALFGSSGPDYVMLHADALQQIENIVTAVILNSDVENAKSELMSFQDLMEYYNATAQDNSPDATVLPLLINYATSLKNHQAYRESYNANAHLLTESYSLVAALTMAVFVEKQLQGQVSHAYVKSIANSLHSSLTYLGGKANGYVGSNVYVRNPIGNCDGVIVYAQDGGEDPAAVNYKAESNFDAAASEAIFNGPGISTETVTQDSFSQFRSDCTYVVYDNIAGTQKRYAIAMYGKTLASRMAYNYKNSKTTEYKNKFKGNDYNTIVSELASY